MRAALAFALLLLPACEKERACAPGTLLVSLELRGGAAAATHLEVSVSLDGAPSKVTGIDHEAGVSRGRLEIYFPSGYRVGARISVEVGAFSAGLMIGRGTAALTLPAGCGTLSLAVSSGGDDLAAGSDGDSSRDADVLDGASDAATIDMASFQEDMATADMVFVPGPSCTGLTANCGPSGMDTCCKSFDIPAGMFYRSYDGVPDGGFEDMSFPATVSNFRLDAFEVTVGRYRQFVATGTGTRATPPSAGAGAHPNLPGSGWDATWNNNLTANTLDQIAALKCDASYQTWSDAAGPNDNRPINCVSWFDAFAFCAWDGGFLATEAEWNYVAAGGNEQRAYPWSSPPPSLTIDSTYAVYNCGGASCTGVSNIGLAGSKSTKGDGRWGHSDLTGNLWEWNLDWETPFQIPCADCANLTAASSRIIRGASYPNNAGLRAGFRGGLPPSGRYKEVGIRCARAR